MPPEISAVNLGSVKLSLRKIDGKEGGAVGELTVKVGQAISMTDLVRRLLRHASLRRKCFWFLRSLDRLRLFTGILNERRLATREEDPILPREDFLEITLTFANSRLPQEDHGALSCRKRPLKCFDSAY